MAVFEQEEEGAEQGGSPRKPRPFRPFKSHEEYLYAMKEDLAEWLQSLYDLEVTADDFMERLETGVVLCGHANRIIATARRCGESLGRTTQVVYRPDVQPGTFHARDNVHNFIQWCKGALRIKECLMFETDDLVMRKNEKNVVLCLLEVARKGHGYGMPAPVLVQMEREIDAEIAACQNGGGAQDNRNTPPSSLSLRGSSDEGGHEADDDYSEGEQQPVVTPRPQIVTNDLRSLHERVAELLNRCSCPAQFPMIRVGDGKYRIGETQLLIFVRILRNHVMVRVGGGWDTLEHYLDKHDPCRCKSGRRISVSRVSPSSSGSIQVHLNSHNRPFSSGTSSSSRSSSVPTSPPSRRRSFDMSRLMTTSPGGTSSAEDTWTVTPNRRQRGGKGGRPSSADSSSEISSEAELLGRGTDAATFLRRQRRYSPRKVMKLGDSCSEETTEESSLEPSRSPPRSRIPMSQSPSPRHRPGHQDVIAFGRKLSASRSETSLFQSAVNRGSRTPGHQGHHPGGGAGARRGVAPRPRSSSSTRTASSSPARTPEWNPSKRRTLSLQSSPVKPVPPLLEEILNDSEVLDSDEKILERMERLINAYRARDPDSSLADDFSTSPARPPSVKNTVRRNSLSKIPVLTWNARQ